jgi:modulator of FtsH protease
MPAYEELGFGRGAALTGDRTRTVFGQVMGLVAFTMAFAALGAYIARDVHSGWFLFFIGAIGCIFGLNIANARGREQLAIVFLFGLGLLLGMSVAPVINYYVSYNPSVVWQAAGATGLFVALMGSIGWATRRDLSALYRFTFIAFCVVLVFGLITLFVAIPNGNVIYCVLMLGIFGIFTLIDFNRLKTANYNMAVPMAASIFLDIFNIFLLLLNLFGGGGRR